jgi:hypothetical protein
VAFRREVHNRGRLMPLQQTPNQIAIANVAMSKFVSTIRPDRLKITQVSGVRELVEVDQRGGRIYFQLPQDEVRPDEPCTAGDQDDILHGLLIVIRKDGLGV